MEKMKLTVGSSILIRRTKGRVHAARIKRFINNKKGIVAEWDEDDEVLQKEISIDEVCRTNSIIHTEPIATETTATETTATETISTGTAIAGRKRSASCSGYKPAKIAKLSKRRGSEEFHEAIIRKLIPQEIERRFLNYEMENEKRFLNYEMEKSKQLDLRNKLAIFYEAHKIHKNQEDDTEAPIEEKAKNMNWDDALAIGNLPKVISANKTHCFDGAGGSAPVEMDESADCGDVIASCFGN